MDIIPLKPLFLNIEIKCPACKKVNTETTCVRCGCDLEVLFSIIEISNNKVNLGKKCLIQNDGKKANEYAFQAWKLIKTRDAAFLGLSASCLDKNYTMANKWLKVIIKIDSDE